jgi:hypothetical protein
MRIVRRVLGLLITVLCFGAAIYGLFQLVRYGSCASGGNYVSTRECSPETGKWNLMLIGGIIVGLLGLGLAFIKGFGPDPKLAQQPTPFPRSGPAVMPGAAQQAALAALFQGATFTSMGTPQAPDQDPIVRLERLQALRDAGALSPAEFEKLKADILAES